MAYSFNTDLLLSEADRDQARKEFPDLSFALDNALLRETFQPYDDRANTAKTRSRRWGVFAVFLATGALLLAGGELLYHDLPKYQIRIIAGIGGIAGIVSVIIGVFGIMFRERKMRWLADRLATERLRQYHFQYYVSNAPKILAGAKDKQLADDFTLERAKDFGVFQEKFLAGVDDELKHLVHAEDIGEGILVDHDENANINPQDPHWRAYLNAYVILRFNRQISYCDYILRERKSFWKQAPVQQAKILGLIAMACVMGILVLHGLVFIGAVANIAWMKGPLVHVFAIWAAIIALTARTFEEGFQPEREIERMRQYRVSLKRIFSRFEQATAPKEKLAAMRDLEKLSYEEMVLFLKSNYEAQFIM